MNRRWLDKQKTRALRAHYREAPYSKETPSEYYIRKRELLDTVFTLDDSELILEIMEGRASHMEHYINNTAVRHRHGNSRLVYVSTKTF